MAPERGARSLPCSTDGLPRAFLQSLRTLFDILDDRRRGSVHLREIESRWQGAEARELPPGVLEGLRQAAPASGYLTFEKFVLGLRASLLSPANGGTAARPAPGGCDPHGKARPAAPKGGPGRGPGEPRPLAEKGGYSSGLAGRSSRSMEKIPSPPGAPAHRAEGDRGGQSHGRRRAEANEGAGAGEGLPAPGAGDGGADLGMVPPADPDSAGAPETPGEKQNHKRLLPGGEPKPPGSPSTQAAGSEPLPQRAPVHLGEASELLLVGVDQTGPCCPHAASCPGRAPASHQCAEGAKPASHQGSDREERANHPAGAGEIRPDQAAV
ncbi:suppressor APC domain-containing protein 2 isoform X3 [Dermochelys coriacea]|uniref:suppressor APC domain-containing protein 2 isoform X3 n=1 Tax=Dermochelys coriacea TaxID=27794 RepID=UPI0018E85C2E|nr:suppressor APC domain-containing protein 2 isoform X3 [Dermochelys coriacea]